MPQNDQQSAFDLATAVRRAEGPALLADLDPTWDVGNGILNGGYLLSVAGRAAVLESPHEHPVAMSASYLRAGAGGPATLEVTPGPAGRTLAHSLVTLADDGGPLITVQATTATLTDAASEYSVPMPEVPGPDECLDMAANAHLAAVPITLPGITQHVHSRLDPATAMWALGQPSEEPVLRAWVRLADGRPADPVSLLLFADVLPPTSFATGKMGWAPTVQLQVLVRGLPAPGWCLVEARASEIAGGWTDEDYRIWDSTGRLVAQSRQLARTAR
ncbi:thioesterase family protein [Blastococcus sp. TBT05-19]|uniref:acyl-CoA thioesterase n=1 Tax=Blastococcus sp. TBT05-19 TaxID=2250581 RepID=UPI000DEA09CA|nr:thioesterase family protein [Blastococcus sp. TBT05-19]RBY94175.1 thioesterase family protein [Blastococcus sp. TBT05-19]